MLARAASIFSKLSVNGMSEILNSVFGKCSSSLLNALAVVPVLSETTKTARSLIVVT
jgi:hypothetical protein